MRMDVGGTALTAYLIGHMRRYVNVALPHRTPINFHLFFIRASLFWFSYLSFSVLFLIFSPALFLQHCVVVAATMAPHSLPLPLPPWSRTNMVYLYERVDISLLYNLCSVWNAPSYYYVIASHPTTSNLISYFFFLFYKWSIFSVLV